MKWNVFVMAVLSAWIVLLWRGAPIAPLLVGAAVVALWNWRKVLVKH
jgi:hypothetical protein